MFWILTPKNVIFTNAWSFKVSGYAEHFFRRELLKLILGWLPSHEHDYGRGWEAHSKTDLQSSFCWYFLFGLVLLYCYIIVGLLGKSILSISLCQHKSHLNMWGVFGLRMGDLPLQVLLKINPSKFNMQHENDGFQIRNLQTSRFLIFRWTMLNFRGCIMRCSSQPWWILEDMPPLSLSFFHSTTSPRSWHQDLQNRRHLERGADVL